MIRSRANSLHLVLFVDATMLMSEYRIYGINGLVELVPCTNKTMHDNAFYILEALYIFADNVNTSSRSYQPIPWNCTDKIYRAEDPRAEDREKQVPKLSRYLKFFSWLMHLLHLISFLNEMLQMLVFRLYAI